MKRFLCAATAVLLLLSACTLPVLAAEDGADTEVFGPGQHGKGDSEGMEQMMKLFPVPDDAQVLESEIMAIKQQMWASTLTLFEQLTKASDSYRQKLNASGVTADQKKALSDQYRQEVKEIRAKLGVAQKPYMEEIRQKKQEMYDIVRNNLPDDAKKLLDEIRTLRDQAHNATAKLREQAKAIGDELNTKLADQSLTDEQKAKLETDAGKQLKELRKKIRDIERPYHEKIRKRMDALSALAGERAA